MLRDRQVAKRYARALFQLSVGPEKESPGAPETVLAELKAFEECLRRDSELRDFFFNPVVDAQLKQEAVETLQGKLTAILKFLKVVIENDRLRILGEIIGEFETYKEEHEGSLRVDLELAHEPSDETLEKIRSTLVSHWKRQPKFKVKVNRELLGGFIARAPGRSFDASVRSQLERMRESLTA